MKLQDLPLHPKISAAVIAKEEREEEMLESGGSNVDE